MQKQIPEKYKSKLIEVTIPGVKAYAWTRESLLEFLSDEISLNFAILGGHVIEIENLEMKYNYDNWYIDERKFGESFGEYCKRANAIARNYLNKYPVKPNILFKLGMTSEITAGL